MKCQRVRKMLLSYLEGELGPSEAEAVRAHLGTCSACRREAEALAAARGVLIQGLRSVGDGATVPSESWEHLQARLAQEAVAPLAKRNRSRLLRRAVFSLSLLLLAAIVTVAAVPPFRARVGEALRTWLHLERQKFAIELFGIQPGFTPLEPTNLPRGLERVGSVMATSQGIRLFFGDPHGKWLLLEETPALGDQEPLEGERIKVRNVEVVVVTASGAVEVPISGRKPFEVRELAYEGATKFVCYMDNTRVELTSNLPRAELVKLIASLRPEGRR